MKNLMLLFVKSLMLFLIISGSAGMASTIEDWKIIKDGDYYLVNNHNSKIKQLLFYDGMVTPEVSGIGESPVDPDILLIEYRSGIAGTSSLVKIYRTVIYNQRAHKFIGESYISKKYTMDEEPEGEQPSWKFEKGKITYKQYGEKYGIQEEITY